MDTHIVHLSLIALALTAPKPPAVVSIERACGSCHRSSVATAKSEALAAFDLDQDRWEASLTRDQWQAFERRVKGTAALDAAQRAAVLEWVRQVSAAAD